MNVMGAYTTADLMLEGNLHTRVLQVKLTPNLVQYMTIIEEELDFAFKVELPQSNGNAYFMYFFRISN
jgi:hypothetical protein